MKSAIKVGFQKKITKKKLKKSKLGKNMCGASVLECMGFPKDIIKKYMLKNEISWKEMEKIINKEEDKIRKTNPKGIIKDLGKTKMKIYPHIEFKHQVKEIINSITNDKNLLKGYSKIIGLTGEFNDKKWGHYVIIGKTKKGQVFLADTQLKKIFNNIMDYLYWEDKGNEMYTTNIIDYRNGLVVSNKKTKQDFLSSFLKKKTNQ